MFISAFIGQSPQAAPHLGCGGTWNQAFSGCCHRLLGAQQNQMLGFIMGGLVGSILGSQGSALGVLAATLGSLMGAMDGHSQAQCCHHRNPSHRGAASFPPMSGHVFGGAVFGGFCFPTRGQGAPYPQPHWCPPRRNHDFGFAHHCPPRHVFHRPRPQPCRPRKPRCRPEKLGHLSQKGKGKPISYTTSGGYKVQIDKHTISITDPKGKNTVKHWGDPHENLNGKHIKDWQTKQRTVVLGDGTKITMGADGPKGITLNTSIYDGRQNVQIDNRTNTVTHHSFNRADTRSRERSQYDGETAVFRTGRGGRAVYSNIYTQDESFKITRSYDLLGRTGGYRNPDKVYDFYDDPTLAHT